MPTAQQQRTGINQMGATMDISAKLFSAVFSDAAKQRSAIVAAHGRMKEAEALAEALASIGGEAHAVRMCDNHVDVWVSVTGSLTSALAAIKAADLVVEGGDRAGDDFSLKLAGLDCEVWSARNHVSLKAA